MTSGATLEQGDADGDGDVDQADYAVWKRDVGTVIDMSAFADTEGFAVRRRAGAVVALAAGCGSALFFAVVAWLERRTS